MRASDIKRITEFENRFARAQATEVVELPWGFAVLQGDFPLSHYHNRVIVTSSARAEDIVEATNEVMTEAQIAHRYVSVNDDVVGLALKTDFEAKGYEHETIVTMIYSGSELEPATHEVRAVSLEAVRPAIIRNWQVELPEASDEELRQLADRTALYARGAELTRLAVWENDQIAASADLYVDAKEQIAQFENLVTHSHFRNLGYANALIRDGLRRGHEADCKLSFLTAELNDWPRRWYQRLGYVDACRTHHFTIS